MDCKGLEKFHQNTIKIIRDATDLFVVKVEVIRIKNSHVGIKFTVIIEPENWEKRRKKYSFHSEINTFKKQNPISTSEHVLTNDFKIWFNAKFRLNDLNSDFTFKFDTWISKKL